MLNSKKISRSEQQIQSDIKRIHEHFDRSSRVARQKRLYPSTIVHNGVVYVRCDFDSCFSDYKSFLMSRYHTAEPLLCRVFSRSAFRKVHSLVERGLLSPSDIFSALCIEDGMDEVLGSSYLFNL